LVFLVFDSRNSEHLIPIYFLFTYRNSFFLEDGRVEHVGHVARMGERRKVYRLLVGKPEGKRPLGRLRRRWVDNIKMNLLEIGWGGVDWIGLTQDRDKWRALVHAVMNLLVP
jgi:hypothetical protein